MHVAVRPSVLVTVKPDNNNNNNNNNNNRNPETEATEQLLAGQVSDYTQSV